MNSFATLLPLRPAGLRRATPPRNLEAQNFQLTKRRFLFVAQVRHHLVQLGVAILGAAACDAANHALCILELLQQNGVLGRKPNGFRLRFAPRFLSDAQVIREPALGVAERVKRFLRLLPRRRQGLGVLNAPQLFLC